jgi:hypothetical protein
MLKLEDPPQNDKDRVKIEIWELHQLMKYRPGLMSEAMAQHHDASNYFRGVLSFNEASHPLTCRLMRVAWRVAQFQVMQYKMRYKRPRPSRVAPTLMPPIDPPGHASFPSGHATEAYLNASLLKEVMPNVAGQTLDWLAARIARNREVIGLHYPSDSRAGRLLAKETFGILKGCESVNVLIGKATKEWNW